MGAIDCMAAQYSIFEAEMEKFRMKVKKLDRSAKSVLQHGEHVFLDARQYRARHPETRNQNVQHCWEAPGMPGGEKKASYIFAGSQDNMDTTLRTAAFAIPDQQSSLPQSGIPPDAPPPPALPGGHSGQ